MTVAFQDQGRDLFAGLGRAPGQDADLLGHHGEAPIAASTCRRIDQRDGWTICHFPSPNAYAAGVKDLAEAGMRPQPQVHRGQTSQVYAVIIENYADCLPLCLFYHI